MTVTRRELAAMLRAARTVAAVREPVHTQRFACAALAAACVATAVFSEQIVGFPHGTGVRAFLFARDGDLPRGNNEESEMSKLRSMVVGSALAVASVASAQNAVQWRTQDGGNGHWYALVPAADPYGWTAAKASAIAMGGYLATTTSPAENQWVFDHVASARWAWNGTGDLHGPWLGAFQDHASGGYSEPGGGWTWVTGEPWNFTSWNPGLPNNAGPQDFLHYYTTNAVQPGPNWDDIEEDFIWPPIGRLVRAAVVEWSADCNNDGIVDYGQILAGDLPDANHNYIPDCCEQGYACDASHELLVNGGLEGGTYAGCASFVALYPGSTAIPGWAIGPNGIDWVWSTPTDSCCDSSPQGDRYIDLNGSPTQDGGAIRQFIQTQVGHRYRISLLAIPNSYGSLAGTPKTIRVTTGSLASEQTLYTLSDGEVPPCDWNTWTHIQREWIATESVSMIELKSLVLNHAGGVFVDAISVTEVGCTNGDCDSLLVPSMYPTIQAAIDSVSAGVHKVISVAAGTYHESFALNGKDVIIRGAANNATILDGAGLATSIATLTGNEPATAGLEQLVFRNATVGTRIYPKAPFLVGGAVYGLQSSAFIRSCRFENNRSDYGGGAYLLYCNMLVENCVFTHNTGVSQGGGLMTFGTTGAVRGCNFTDNLCGVAGAGGGSAFKAAGTLHTGELVTFENCTATGNTANVIGGAVEFYENVELNPGVMHVVNSTITGNRSGLNALTDSGGLVVTGRMQSCVVMDGTTLCSNLPRNTSGPFYIQGNPTICDCMADVTGDGVVNGADLGLVLNSWGATSPTGTGDVNHDGVVNAADLALLLGSWGPCH